MKIVAFLNPKAGVGCTSLVYHLAWMYSELGYRVVAVDADPQADLSGMFLGFDEAPWLRSDDPNTAAAASLGHALKYGVANDGREYTRAIASNLDFVASSYLFLEHLMQAAGAQTLRNPLSTDPRPPSLARFRRLLLTIAAAKETDLILVDAGAGISASACLATVSSDSLIIPTSPDTPSGVGLHELLREHQLWLQSWRAFVANVTSSVADPGPNHLVDGLSINDRSWLGDGPSLLGYVLTSEAYYGSFLLSSQTSQSQQRTGMTEWLAQEGNVERLGALRRHPSLRDLSLQARKPMFALTPADGALGSITVAVQRCRSEYTELARHIADRLGLAAPH